MGKIRERRFKIHKLIKYKSTPNLDEDSPKNVPPLLIANNIFSGLNINIDDITKPKDADFDKQSISGKSYKDIKKEEQDLPKKEKLKRRHERFMQKLDLGQKLKANLKAKKKREKKAITGDLQPLIDSLPTISEIEKTPKTREIKMKPRLSMKVRRKQREHIKDVQQFHKILNDKVFRTNPTSAITEFLKQKLAHERPDLQQ